MLVESKLSVVIVYVVEVGILSPAAEKFETWALVAALTAGSSKKQVFFTFLPY